MQREYSRSISRPPEPASLDALALTRGLLSAQLRLHSRQMMIRLSHLIEEHGAASGGATLISCFQRLSLYARAASRYRRLTAQFAQVIVFGYLDAAPPQLPNVTVVPLEVGWPLVEEWCVIASGPACSLALLARDAEGFSQTRRSIKFHALWTSDRAMVDSAVERCMHALGRPAPAFERDPEATLRTTLALRRSLATLPE